MSKYHYVRCTVTGNALAKSSSKGTPSVKIALETVAKENEPSRPLWCDLWLTDATVERTIETLEKVLGWQGKSFAELNAPCFDGVEVVAVCEYEMDDKGIEREKVAFLNSTAGGGVTINDGVFAANDWVFIENSSGSAITITQDTGMTLRLHGTATTGSRTLAVYGGAAIRFKTNSDAIVYGDVT